MDVVTPFARWLMRPAAMVTLLAAPALWGAHRPAEVGTWVAGYQDDFPGTRLNPAWRAVGPGGPFGSVSNGVLTVRSASGDPNHLLLTAAGYDATRQQILARIRVVAFGSGDFPRGGISVGVDPVSSQGINYHFRDHASEGQTGRHMAFLDDLRSWGPGADFSWQTNTWYWVRLWQEPDAASQGGLSDVFARIWQADGSVEEPTSWQTWDYAPAAGLRSGLAGIAAGSAAGLSEFEVDYVLVQAAGLPTLLVSPEAFPPSYQTVSVGSAQSLGTLTSLPGGCEITARGSGLGRTVDEIFFAGLPCSGDFDVQVRLEALGPGDPWARAGLMARDDSGSSAPYAAVVATPATAGIGFQARAATGGAFSAAGAFPVNYPHSWLRLRRSGNQFTGYASLEAREWTRLGSATVPLVGTVQLGFLVASHRPGESITARFRDFGPVTMPTTNASTPAFEPMGQSSRLTPIVFSEIMFNPGGTNADAFEYVELFNPFATAEDLSGYRLTGDIDFTFPTNTILAGGAFLVVARDPAMLQTRHRLPQLLGPFAGRLSDSGGVLRLRHRTGALFLEVNYRTRSPWPGAADGTGHSLVLARPSYGENDPRAWAASDSVGGSPGSLDARGPEPLRKVRINEFLAHTDDPQLDFIEIYNHGATAVDISGCWLSDDRLVMQGSAPVRGFQIPGPWVLQPGGFAAFNQVTLGFALKAGGETLILANPSRTRVLDLVEYAAQANGVSTGRSPDGAADFHPLPLPSPGTANAGFVAPDVVINEIHYAPLSGLEGDEFLELHNRGAQPVALGGWRLTDGVEFEFPGGTMIPPGGFLVIAGNTTNFLARHGGTPAASALVGAFTGNLSNGGERLALSQPERLVSTNALGQIVTVTNWMVMDEVTYGTGGRWGRWSDGGGSSLELVDARADNRRASQWADSDETAKAPWTVVSFSGRLDQGDVAADQLQVLLLGAGECLIDEVEVLDASGSNRVANPSFQAGAGGWTAEGTLSGSSWASAGGDGDSGCYHIRAVDRGDNQVNRVRTPLTAPLASGSSATLRARVRWLKGHPEILLRLRGKWLETVARMEPPLRPGTPGQPNGRARANHAPALFDVSHSPVLPAGGETVTVTARVHDPDGLAAVQLEYRVDPAATVSTLPLRDDGTAGDAVSGDGTFSAALPPQPAGTLVAFRLRATDQHASPATATFPADAPVRECLVRFGETESPGAIPAYRLWMTRATFDTWTARHNLDNTPSDLTFVLGNQRVIYNAQGLFAGSPYIAPGFNTPSGNRCGYSLLFPPDDPFLGGTDLVLDWPGGHGNEETALQEQMAYWLADRMDLPFSLRHYIRLHVNGVTDMQRGGVFEAVLQPARDFVRAWTPADADGEFYKIDRAFEFSDGGSLMADPMPTLEVFTTTGGAKKTARYRWNWLKRSYDRADNYTQLFDLVDALNAPGPEPYTSATLARVDVEQWMGIFAFEHIINNFDSWGHVIGKNMYAYKPATGPWQLYAFDLDWLMLVSPRFSSLYTASQGPLFNSHDPTVTRMFNHPPFRRAYFRAVQRAVDGPLASERCDPVMTAKHRWLVDEGVTMCDGAALVEPSAVQQWFGERRAALQAQLAAVAAPFTLSDPAFFASPTNPITLGGTAPIRVAKILVNGVSLEPTWTSVNAFRLEVPLWRPRTNLLVLQGVDVHGNPVAGAQAQLSVDFTGPPPPVWNRQVRINEWMADNATTLRDPADQRADDWIELYNTGIAPADLTGFYLTDAPADWTKWPIPDGTVIPPGGYLLVWADAEPLQNGANPTDLHAAFQLAKGGDGIALFAPDGTAVDSVAFGPQAEDVSQGRFPDGGSPVDFLTRPTPRGPNARPYEAAGGAPRLDPGAVVWSAGQVRLGWRAAVGGAYLVLYKDDLNDGSWQPLPGPVTAVAPIATLVDPAAGRPHRFYLLQFNGAANP